MSFQLLEILGKGAFGKVYLAKDTESKELRAIKVIDLDVKRSEEVSELIKETQILALCSHPNVTRYYESVIRAESVWIITEYIEVGSLRQLVIRSLVVSAIDLP